MKLLGLLGVLLLSTVMFGQQHHPKPLRPTTMKIDKVMWKVEWWRPDTMKYYDFATRKTVPISGYTDCEDHLIRIAMDEDLADTILHETQHAITGCSIEAGWHHYFIYKYSAALARWIQDNPQWVRYIQSLPHPDNYFDAE